MLKIASWNVNGILVREDQVLEWIEREPGSGLPAGAQIDRGSGAGGALRAPGISLSLAWRARLLGCGAALPARRICRRAAVSPSCFRHRNSYRHGQVGDLLFVSVYVPNGGKDFAAKMDFLRQMEAFIGEAHAGGLRIVLCGDINIARSERDERPKERNPTVVGQRPGERESSASAGARARRCRPRRGPGQR
jgi:exodeoxyribonuclease-3